MENLKALVYGRKLTDYQRMLAQKEFEALTKAASNSKNTGKKVAIIGGGDTHAHEELAKILASKLHNDVEIVKFDKKEVKQRLEIEKMPLIDPVFTPPPTRKERRKNKNNKKRK